MKPMNRIIPTLFLIAVTGLFAVSAQAKSAKPNILVIWGDDIGESNVSAYSRGLMGYKTPNIDRIANEGALFTDYYAEQSCTAGRSAFITGQYALRTGLTKVGLPGAKLGLSDEDPTLAELLKNHGYATGQFGKNHLGDRNEYLPTVHGFDEFFGNLYHLDAEEEPEQPMYPKDPRFKQLFGPRGVLHTWATDKKDKTDDPRWGVVGKQKIEDTGPLTRARMPDVDEEFLAETVRFIEEAHKDGKPFFVWFNPTRMHVFTHLNDKYAAMVGEKGLYGAGMTQLDDNVGMLLDKLDQLGIADNTIVMFSTDNGVEKMTWPDGGSAPYRGEKNTTWEGGFRVPAVVRWPGVIKPGTVINDIFSHHDWLPTLMAAVGEPDIKEKLKKGHKANGKTFKVHIDGHNQMDLLKGEGPGKRQEFFYVTDDGELSAIRYKRWKVMFSRQDAIGFDVWARPLTPLRLPLILDLRADPYEITADQEATTGHRWWQAENFYALYGAQAVVKPWVESFKEFPPRQAPAKFNVSDIVQQLSEAEAAGQR
jgi:arylsulfatase